MAIIVSIIVALMLTLLPMPASIIWLKPSWVLMVLIYWTMVVPHRVNTGTAFLVGLIMDLLMGTLLGEHALAMTVVIYFVSRLYMRIQMYPLAQQGFSVFLFVLLYQFILFCTEGFIGQLPPSHLYWMSAVTSTLLWPWFFIIMRNFRRRCWVA